MNDKNELLQQLRIDRSDASPRRRSKWLWLLVLLALGALGAAAWWGRPGAVPITVAVAEPVQHAATAAAVLDASGYVVARRQATVSSKVTGKVTALLIEEGQQVQEGQVLARIDDSNARAQRALAQSQLHASRASLAEVRVQLQEAERQLARTEELAGRGLVSQSAWDAAQANVDALRARLESQERQVVVAQRNVEVQERLLEDTVVRAPFTGVITVKNAQEGEMISPLSAGGAGTRTGIGTLVDMKSLEVEVDVNENFINRVHAGQPVVATLNAYPEWKIPAEVIAVVPTADRSKATVKVRVGFRELDSRILPDMGVRVAFMDPKSQQAPAQSAVRIPATAVHEDGAQTVVYVVQDGRVERRAVRLGTKDDANILVLAGLRAGENVALGDLARLSDGARVQVRSDE